LEEVQVQLVEAGLEEAMDLAVLVGLMEEEVVAEWKMVIKARYLAEVVMEQLELFGLLLRDYFHQLTHRICEDDNTVYIFNTSGTILF
jgi:hypothetical protein